MAKKSVAEAEPEAIEQLAGSTKQPDKFAVSRLRQDCVTLFDLTTSAFDGATYGLNGDFTVEEMRAHIDKWLKKPINKEAK